MPEIKHRSPVKTVAALLILIFHLWINLFTGNKLEEFFKQTAYVGVDIFFLISGYSLAQSFVKRQIADKKEYWKFVFSRFRAVYIKFALFAVVVFIYKKWKVSKLILTLCGVELFRRGGGSFLWFLPVIMLVYILLPLYAKLDKKNRKLAAISVLAGWFIIGLAIWKLTGYKAMYIFWNRIPVVLVGYYWGIFALKAENEKLVNKNAGVSGCTYTKKFCGKYDSRQMTIFALMLITFLTGTILLYGYGYKPRLQYPMPDMFYVLAIPSAVGLTYMISLIPEGKIIKYIGKSTLEIYGVQMVFGYDICNKMVNIISRNANINWAVALGLNLIVTALVISLSVLISQGYTVIEGKIMKNGK